MLIYTVSKVHEICAHSMKCAFKKTYLLHSFEGTPLWEKLSKVSKKKAS